MKKRFVSQRRMSITLGVMITCLCLSRLRASALLSLFFATLLAPMVAQAQQPEGLSPVAYVRAAPIKETLAEFQEVARAIAPNNPQVEAMPLMLGQMLGDPGLESFYDTDDIAILVFMPGLQQPPAAVVAAKIRKDSPVRRQAQTMGLTMVDKLGWTFFGQDAMALSAIGSGKKLLPILQKNRATDIEIGIWPGRALQQRALISMMTPVMLSQIPQLANNQDAVLNLTTSASALLDELASLESLIFGINMDADQITLQTVAKAQDGTPLNLFFSQSVGGKPLEMASYVPDGGMFVVAQQFDSAALSNYSEHLFSSFGDRMTEDLQSPIKRFKDLTVQQYNLLDSTNIAQVGIQGDGSQSMISIVGLNDTDSGDQALAIMRNYNEFLFTEIMGSELFAAMPFTYMVEQNEDVAEEGGISIRSTKILTESDDPEMAAHLPPAQNIYQAVIQDKMLVTSSVELMKELIQRVQAKKPAPDNLAGLTLRAGTAMRYKMYMKQYIMMMVEPMREIYGDNYVQAVSQQLEEIEVKPIVGSLGFQKGRMLSTTVVPLDSISLITQFFSQLEGLDAE